jgi:hypothetical protein
MSVCQILASLLPSKAATKAEYWWFMPIILATQEGEFRRIARPYLGKKPITK